jgi:hypothetical protein
MLQNRFVEIVRQTNDAARQAVPASIEGDAKKALAALDRGGGQIVESADRAERSPPSPSDMPDSIKLAATAPSL